MNEYDELLARLGTASIRNAVEDEAAAAIRARKGTGNDAPADTQGGE